MLGRGRHAGGLTRRLKVGVLGEQRSELPVDVVVSPLVVSAPDNGRHGSLVLHKGLHSVVEFGRRGLHVRAEKPVRAREVVVFLFVHFLLENDLLGDAEALAGASLVDFAGHARRLDASLEAAICAARGCYVCSLLVFFMGSLRLFADLVNETARARRMTLSGEAYLLEGCGVAHGFKAAIV